MIEVRGQCYPVREQLKELGCIWDGDAWMAPDAVHAQAQGIVDVENMRAWQEFLGTLAWSEGNFTATVWDAALRAASLFIPYQVAFDEIAGRVRTEKHVADNWFERNISRAFAAAGIDSKSSGFRGQRSGEERARATFKNECLAKVAGTMVTEVSTQWLRERSAIDPFEMDPGQFLEFLYEPGERVVIFDSFRSQGQWIWDHERGFRSSTIAPAAVYETKGKPYERDGGHFSAGFAGPGDGVWYLCNPVDGDWHWMEDGENSRWSRRWEPCVTSWRYMVLESDKADARQWVAMAVQLPLRISAIYTSGGKSVHVLVRVDARSKAQWDEWKEQIKPILVTLGADPGCLSAVRLTRLPGCRRGDKFQKLLYLNPAPTMAPIASVAARRND